MKTWLIVTIIIYIFGVFFIGRKGCCGCEEHFGSDIFNLFFWFVAYPYYLIKDKVEEKKQ